MTESPAISVVASQQLPLVLASPNPQQNFWRGLVTLVGHLRAHRQLIWAMCMRDIRLKYRGSAVGYVWSLLDPLLMAITFVALFALMSRGKQDPMYSLLVVNGVIMWSLFGACAARGQGSLTQNGSLIESIYVPREIFGLSSILAQMIMTVLSLFVSVPFLIYLKGTPTWQAVFYVPAGLLLSAAFATGLGMGTAPWNVLNRDVEYFFNFILRAGMYLSPVMWDVESIPPSLRHVVLYNPLCVPMEMVKKSIAGRPLGIPDGWVIYSCVMCVVVLVVGLGVFRKLEGSVVKKL
jgi:ABC-type polysaccharide/polyol phosphate export permease